MSNLNALVKKSVLTFDLPFMINLPDGPYQVKTDQFNATVYIKRFRSPSEMPGLPKGVRFPPDAYVKGDKYGRFNYSKIRIEIHYDVLIKPGVTFQDTLLLKSVDIINNILDVCRGVKGDHYIRISDSDIFSHNLTYLNAESQEVPGGAFAIGGQLEIGTGGAYEPSQQEVSKIKNILAIDARLPLWQTLLFDAYDHHFYRNYRIAIVEAGTAFEVFIYNFIGKGYDRLGKTKQEIENKLQARFKNLICDHIQILTGFDFCNSTEYENWNNHAYKVRNRIVHRGGKTTDIESSKAVTTVGDTIKFLISLNYL